MHLPNAHQATVEDRKIKEYLLNQNHPDGGSKAKFFLLRGFAPEEPEKLREVLLQHARTGQVVKEEETTFGTKYVIQGDVLVEFFAGTVTRAIPAVDIINLQSVWIIAPGTGQPKLVTAYPMKS